MENKKLKRRSLIIDIIILAVLLMVSIVSFYIAYSFGLLPIKRAAIAAVTFGLLFLILLLLAFKQIPTWGLVIKRLLLILLVAIVDTFGYFMEKSRATINKMSKTTKVNDDGTATITTNLYLITSKTSGIRGEAGLADKTIGLQNGSDADNLSLAKTSVLKDISSYTAKEGMDYTTLYDQMEQGNISITAISETPHDTPKANIKDFEENVQILKTYSKADTIKTKEQKDITKQTFTAHLNDLGSTGSSDQQTCTDINLLLIVSPVANHIDMVSIPRDVLVPNTTLNSANDKLTHTGIYGTDTSVDTISQFFGIPVDYYARVSFSSTIEIVDTIGGIDVGVELDFCEQDENRSFKKDDLICLKKGEQHLDGEQALAYSRHRKIKGYDNAGRERAQQCIIKAIINKLISPSALGYVNDLLDVAPNYVIIDMPANQITKFVSSKLDNMKPWTISSVVPDIGVYDSQQIANLNPLEGPYDVYPFNKDGVHAVVNTYDGVGNQLQMESFHFSVDDLYRDTPPINDDPNIIWGTMASAPHQQPYENTL